MNFFLEDLDQASIFSDFTTWNFVEKLVLDSGFSPSIILVRSWPINKSTLRLDEMLSWNRQTLKTIACMYGIWSSCLYRGKLEVVFVCLIVLGFLFVVFWGFFVFIKFLLNLLLNFLTMNIFFNWILTIIWIRHPLVMNRTD